MPFEYPWCHVLHLQGTALCNQTLDTLRTLKSYTNQLKHCTACETNLDDHKMLYRVWSCNSSTCRATREQCTYWVRVRSCGQQDTHDFFEYGRHSSPVGSPRSRPFTRSMKAVVRSMVRSSMKPARIRNELIDRFGLTAATVPALKTIQNFVYNFKQSVLFHSDVVEDVVAQARNSQYSINLDETTAFSFGYQVDHDGNPILGDGTDEDPFVLAFSTKALLRNLDRDAESFNFHMDATFKLTKRKFPLFVCGISDAARAFHPVAFYIVSQRTEVQYSAALRALMDKFLEVVGREAQIKYFMADAEDAQHNAFTAEIASVMESSYLMCFFHVIKNVKDKLKDLRVSDYGVHMAYRLIYEMHYARSETEYEAAKKYALARWLGGGGGGGNTNKTSTAPGGVMTSLEELPTTVKDFYHMTCHTVHPDLCKLTEVQTSWGTIAVDAHIPHLARHHHGASICTTAATVVTPSAGWPTEPPSPCKPLDLFQSQRSHNLPIGPSLPYYFYFNHTSNKIFALRVIATVVSSGVLAETEVAQTLGLLGLPGVGYGAPGYGYGVGPAVSVGVGNGGVGVGANVLGLGAHVGVGLPGVGYPAGYPVNGVPSAGVYNAPPPAVNSAPAYNNAPATVVNGAPASTATTTGGNGASTTNVNANANVNGGNNPYSTKTVTVTNGDGTSNTASASNGNGAAANGGASASASASASARATTGASATSSQKTYRQLRSVE